MISCFSLFYCPQHGQGGSAGGKEKKNAWCMMKGFSGTCKAATSFCIFVLLFSMAW
jgi:hypothetical protein